MAKKILITLNEEQEKALNDLMKEDLQHNRSAYIGLLVANEVKRREENKKKRGPGRPPKEEGEEEDINLYAHPTNPSLHVTKEEWEAYYEYNGLPIPDKMPAPVGTKQ